MEKNIVFWAPINWTSRFCPSILAVVDKPKVHCVGQMTWCDENNLTSNDPKIHILIFLIWLFSGIMDNQSFFSFKPYWNWYVHIIFTTPKNTLQTATWTEKNKHLAFRRRILDYSGGGLEDVARCSVFICSSFTVVWCWKPSETSLLGNVFDTCKHQIPRKLWGIHDRSTNNLCFFSSERWNTLTHFPFISQLLCYCVTPRRLHAFFSPCIWSQAFKRVVLKL